MTCCRAANAILEQAHLAGAAVVLRHDRDGREVLRRHGVNSPVAGIAVKQGHGVELKAVRLRGLRDIVGQLRTVLDDE